MSVLRTKTHWWDDHYRAVDTGVSVACGVGTWWLCQKYDCTVSSMLSGDRSALYGTIATIFGALVGFVITSYSIIIGFMSNERMQVLRGTPAVEGIFGVYLWGAVWVGIATIAPIVGLVCDRDPAKTKPWMCALILGTTVAGVGALVRCLRILSSASKRVVSVPPVPQGATGEGRP